MKTAVVYARYSSSNQTEQSIEGQMHVCQDFAKRNNIIIVDSYIDRAISGTTDERDSFQRMLKDSDNRKWDYVLVYKLDRFARNKYEAAIHRKHLKDNGIKLLSAMENIPETPEGVLLESLLEGMNQYFSEELAQKVNRGLHESRMKGHCIGSVPFGYTKENNKMLTINENEQKVLQRIFEDYASGKTILQISRDFEKEGITNKGRKFIPETIRDILKREIYTGICKINGKVYDKIYPPIINKELYDKVQKRMALTRYGCRKDNHEIFKLKDKIYCGDCNRKMYPVTAKSGNGTTLRYYNCISTKKDNCHVTRIHKDFIENIVYKFFQTQFNIPENLEKVSTAIYEEYLKRTKNNNSLSNLKSDLQRVNSAIVNIMSAIEKGILTETTKSRLEELETQRKVLGEKLVIEESKSNFELTKEDIQNKFKTVMDKSPERVIELFVKSVKVYEDKIEIELNCTLNTTNEEHQPIKNYVFTETKETTRNYKTGTKRKKIISYAVYSVI